MRSYPVKRPLCAMTLFFIMGLWVCAMRADAAGWGVFFLPFLALVVLGVATDARRTLACALAFVVGFALLFGDYSASQALTPLHGEDATIALKVTRAPTGATYVDGEVLSVDGQMLEEPVRLRVKRSYGDTTPYSVRAVYSFMGSLTAPEVQRNPGGFDEKTMLARKGIFTPLETKKPATLVAAAPAWSQRVSAIKTRAFAVCDAYLDEGEAALVKAVLFGDVSALSDDFYTASQQFGIIHIFSVSGLHVGFILAFILGVAKLLRREHSPWLLALLVPLLSLYTLLCEASPPSIRASLMGILGLLTLRLLRYRDTLTLLALAALALLISDPFNLFSIGFELSFLAMLGVVVIAPRIEALLHPLPRTLSVGIATSLGAELATAPLVTYYFYMLTPLSTVMNLLVVPFFSVLVPLALLAILGALVLPFLGTLFFLPIKGLILVILALMDGMRVFTGMLHFYVGQPSVWFIIVLYAAVLLFCLSANRPSLSLAPQCCQLDAKRSGANAIGAPQRAEKPQQKNKSNNKSALILVLCFTMLATLVVRPAVPENLRLTMVDVGQGSGSVYHSEEGAWLVFDTGPSKDTMAQYLRYAGCNHIEGVVLSHSDSDHITGLAHLLRDFKVDAVFASAVAQDSNEWQTLVPYLKKTQVVTITKDTTLTLGESATLRLSLVDESKEASENANQVVARLEGASASYLFPGDSNKDALRDLARPTDVVLVPHHGSKNSWSQAFYQAVQPKLALISAGVNNRYGHPSLVVTDGLTDLHIPYRTTARSGAVILYDTENGLAMETFIK